MSDNAKETSNRAELRDRIIVKATEAFTAHGIKSITMDDIATSLVYRNVRFMKFLRTKKLC